MKMRTVADWKAAVYKHRGLTGSAKVMLLYLADHMDGRLQVSVPRRQIAADLGVNVRRVTEWTQTAVTVGFLDHVRKGRPGVTAAYAGTFPSPRGGLPAINTKSTNQDTEHGAPVRTNQDTEHGAKKRTMWTAQHGADGGPANSKHNQSETLGRQPTDACSTRTTPSCAPAENPRVNEPMPVGSIQEFRDFMNMHASVGVSDEVADVEPAERARGPELAKGVQPYSPPSIKASMIDGVDRETRRRLLDAIQNCPTLAEDLDAVGIDSKSRTRLPSPELCDLLEEVQGGLGDWAINYWTFTDAVAGDRYLAGTQLNMLINTYRTEAA